MAQTCPLKNPLKVLHKKRFEFLKKYLTVGAPRVIDYGLRRRSFDNYKAVHLPDIWKQRCYLCLKRAEHWHHIVPVSRGGDDYWTNIVPLCKECHKRLHRHGYVRPNRKPKVHISPLVMPEVSIVYVPPELCLAEKR